MAMQLVTVYGKFNRIVEQREIDRDNAQHFANRYRDQGYRVTVQNV